MSDTLEFVSAVSDTGSAIIFTYVRQGIIDGTDRPEWSQSLLAFARRVGSLFTFGLDPAGLERYLADHGLTLVDDAGADDYQALYLEPLRREMCVSDVERVAFAKVDG